MTVRASALPTESSLASGYDLADAYVRHDTRYQWFGEGNLGPSFCLVQGTCACGIVAPFGIKTTSSLLKEAVPEKIYFFPVVHRTSTEVIVGEVDVHLDFQASILLGKALPDGRRELIPTTAVHCHNRLGRIYLFLIRPLHGVVVRDFMHRAEWRLRRSASE
jgi:hypothetical protein